MSIRLNGVEVIWCLYLICASILWFFSSHLHGCTCHHWKSGVFINFQFQKSWFDHKDVTLFWKPETRNWLSGFRFHPNIRNGQNTTRKSSKGSKEINIICWGGQETKALATTSALYWTQPMRKKRPTDQGALPREEKSTRSEASKLMCMQRSISQWNHQRGLKSQEDGFSIERTFNRARDLYSPL